MNGPGSRQNHQPTPPRQSSLPSAPGLPARPAFAPVVSRSQLHDLHSGHKVSGIEHASTPKEKERSEFDDAFDKLIEGGRAAAARIDAEKAAKLSQAGQQPNGTKAIESSNQIDTKEISDTSSDGQQVQQSADNVTQNGESAQHPSDDVVGNRLSMDKSATNGHEEEVSKSVVPTEKTRKPIVLVVRDLESSPEENMARMSRYSFTPRKPETYLGRH